MAESPQARSRRAYVEGIARVMAYVHDHLDGDLRLATLAGVAGFSPYHFHRVFRAIVGETLHDFVRRTRAQAAARALVQRPELPISEVARSCGYSSPAVFAREFRHHFGLTATRYRQASNIGQAEGKLRKAAAPEMEYARATFGAKERSQAMEATFEIKEIPAMHVACVRHVGPYNRIGEAFERLMAWAGPRGLLRFPDTATLAVYHDSPEDTHASELRSDACVTVPRGTEVDGEVSTMEIPGGLFAVGHFVLDHTEYAAAWDRLMGEFLPESGHQPDERLCYELYRNDPAQHPEGKHIVDICEPVRPL